MTNWIPSLDRRTFLGASLAGGAALALGAKPAPGKVPPLEEATLEQLQAGLASGRWTSVSLAVSYQKRIRALDQAGPNLRSVLEFNPDAQKLAAALDGERKRKGPRGPLHGIPVLLKDNLDTADRMRTTAGSLALLEAPPPTRDAEVVARLREAGALILGKTNLSEWANIRSTRSTSGWSARGGQTRNPYALDRNPSGSSSGSAVAVAANLCALAVGTETDGSITSPASTCGIVGLKPTVGLLSGAGIIPIAHTQDTAGPMARTVRDAAIVLGAMGASAHPKGQRDYAAALDGTGLKGARLGVARNLFGSQPDVKALIQGSLDRLKLAGAELVEVELGSSAYDSQELEVLLFELKADLNAYLQGRGGKVKELAALIAFNDAHRAKEMPFFGQELFLQAQGKGPLTDPVYLQALETCGRLSRAEGIDKVMDAHRLDALLAPTNGPAWVTDPINGDHYGASCTTPAAVAGYPHLTVPAGFVRGLPIGLSFFGRAWSEATILKLGFAFEQLTRCRRPPRFLPSVTIGGETPA